MPKKPRPRSFPVLSKNSKRNAAFFCINARRCTRRSMVSCAATDPDWLLLFRLHYSLIEMEQRHPWLKKEDLA